MRGEREFEGVALCASCRKRRDTASEMHEAIRLCTPCSDRREALFEARLQAAKELLRIEQAVVRAAVERTPMAELVITWNDGEPVSRITLWRLRVHLGLVKRKASGRSLLEARP